MVETTTFAMMEVGGGGYACGLAITEDGHGNVRCLLRNDEPSGFLWRSSSPTAWVNVLTNPRIAGIDAGSMGGVYEWAWGKPSPGVYPRAYGCFGNPLTGTEGTNSRPNNRNTVYRSDDGGETWTPTATSGPLAGARFSGDGTNKFPGPHMAVDPNNPDICYLMGLSGAVYVTYNGGATWRVVSALLGALKSATCNANNTGGNNTVLVDVNPIAPSAAAQYYAYDVQHEFALGTNSGFDQVTQSSATWTGSISGTVLTVTANNYGLVVGDVIGTSGASPITNGTQILSQRVLGSVANYAALPGGAAVGDTYFSNADNGYFVFTGSVWGRTTATMTHTGFNELTLTGVSGYLQLYSPISGTGIPANCILIQQLTGFPGRDGAYLTAVFNVDHYDYIDLPSASGTLTLIGTTPLGNIGQYNVSISQTVSSELMYPRTIHVSQLNNASGGSGVGAAVSSGDTIKFSMGASVAIDGDSGTVANPGIALGEPGAAGLASKIAYFGWARGTTTMWWMQNGDPELATAMPAGGPVDLGGGTIAGKIKISNDAVLRGGGCGVLYVTDGDTRGWRFSSTPPTGSGLPTNTWLHLPNNTGSGLCTIVPDPFVAGRIAMISYRQLINAISLDYGATLFSGSNGALVPLVGQGGTDSPWLATCADIFGSDCWWDPVIQHKMWSLSGLGVWLCTIPTTPGGFTQSITTMSKGMDSLIPCQVRKIQQPGGRILFSGEDRPFFSKTSPTALTTNYEPNTGVGGGVNHGFDIAYSEANKNVCWGSAGSSYKSTDSGVTWTFLNGVPGWSTFASLTGNNCIAVPANNTGYILYTTNGGTNWNTSTFNGNPLIGTGGTAFGNFFHLCHNFSNTYYWYDNQVTNPLGQPTLFKSTDGGATWQIVKQNLLMPNTDAPLGAALKCVPGFPTHLVYAPGYNGAAYWNAPRQIYRSTDSGVNWTVIPNIWAGILLAFGKALPGGSGYPTAYMAGQLVSGGTSGIWKCTDFNVANPVWELLPGLREVTCDGWRGQMDGDMDVYGTIYGGTSGAGLWFGVVAGEPPIIPSGPGPGLRTLSSEYDVYWTRPTRIPQV